MRCEELNDALAFMVCKDVLPLKTNENEGFLHFAKVAVPQWTPESRKSQTRRVDKKYDRVVEELRSIISALPSMSMTFDIWTSQHTKISYLGGTLHYKDDESRKMKMITLSIIELNESHTAEYLEEIIKQMLVDWNIDKEKVSLVITDNAPNILNAVKSVFGSNKVSPCFDHTLNLIPANAFGVKKSKDGKETENVPGLPALLKKVKDIVTYTHRGRCPDELRKA